jgi:transglutaminase-like putative cysteine protease
VTVTDRGLAWRLRIKHLTGFTYAGTAYASYNEARMTPLTGPGQNTLFSHIECTPGAVTWRYRDYWGTQVTVFDLQRPHQQLTVTASSLVETVDQPDPDATAEIDWATLRAESTVDAHLEYLTPTELTTVDDELAEQAASLAGDRSPSAAAAAVAEWVQANVAYVPGSTGVRTSAREAWALRQGVCQDIAQLTAGMLRTVGIPARYVSGYLYPRTEAPIGDTVAGQSHAWVEWWTGQWHGFDPTNGWPVGRRHVVVARGRDYADVTPLKGVYHGAPSSELGVTVEIPRLA